MSTERLMTVLLGPHLSEKSTRLGEKHNQIVFRVRRDATKAEIRAAVEALFEAPLHPYTAGLLNSLPRLDQRTALTPIEGNVPDALSFPEGCRFHPRCPLRLARCERETPTLTRLRDDTRSAACFYRQQHPDTDLLRLMVDQHEERCGG